MSSLSNSPQTYINPAVETLIQHCLEFDNCKLASNGAVVAYSGKYCGRTPKDKFFVRQAHSESEIWWDNNGSVDSEQFQKISAKASGYLDSSPKYIIDTFAGADSHYRIAVRFIVERPYHALFIKQLLIRPSEEELANFSPDWTVRDAGKLSLDPAVDGTRNDAFIGINIDQKEVVIVGTEYAGEMKKAVFTIMNYLLPKQGVMSMHCSANIGKCGDTALFFGLSGTGKTTLSADPERMLIGDDEHGWTDEGVFNIEGGCYAKCIRLKASSEPEIWTAIRSGSVLENVILDSSGTPDYDDDSLTENTRAAYPLEHIPHAVHPSVGGHPQNIVFLTCDALGVLPPISRLSVEQAMEHFLNGYTAKVAGTEAGVTEPTVTFSACFGAPFLPLHPKVYAHLLGEKIRKHGAQVWLINTGWTGGPYGVGSRIKLAYTRAMLKAAFSGVLENVEFVFDPIFGLHVPVCCPEVPNELLIPRATWADPGAYAGLAMKLKALFDANLAKFA